MKFCAVQTRPVKGNVSANIDRHITLLHSACDAGADAVFFPELSITGYEPGLAAELACTQNDKRFAVFQNIADVRQVTIGIGVPALSAEGVRVSMFVFQSGVLPQTYSKQLLHPDEEPFFLTGSGNLEFEVRGIKVAVVICYEISDALITEQALNKGAEIYVASVAKSSEGLKRAFVTLAETARKYRIPVLLANSIGPSDDFIAGGRSAVWNEKGELLAEMDGTGEGLAFYDFDTGVGSIFYAKL
ncbi:MAG: carbon-nitrogen hydrolase family protein [Bacteroidota bacterium]